MRSTFDPLATARLQLVPFDEETARAVLAGDLGALDPGEGWPQAGTRAGLSMAVERGHPAGWMVTLGGKVIGDCGTHGPADPDGVVEIGYGLAAPYWGRGFGTELVAACTAWLLVQPGVRAVAATTLADNLASRRVLEKNGFRLTGRDGEGRTLYRRDP